MSDDGSRNVGCAVWVAAIIIGCALMVIEVFVGQWLFGVFGWEFGFWKMLGVLLAFNLIFGGIRLGSGGGRR